MPHLYSPASPFFSVYLKAMKKKFPTVKRFKKLCLLHLHRIKKKDLPSPESLTLPPPWNSGQSNSCKKMEQYVAAAHSKGPSWVLSMPQSQMNSSGNLRVLLTCRKQ